MNKPPFRGQNFYSQSLLTHLPEGASLTLSDYCDLTNFRCIEISFGKRNSFSLLFCNDKLFLKVLEFAYWQMRCVKRKRVKVVIGNVHPNESAISDNESVVQNRDIFFRKY